MTPQTLPASPDRRDRAVMSQRRIWRAYRVEARYELLRMLRTPTFVVPTLLLPTFLYVLVSVAMVPPHTPPRRVAALFTGFCAFAIAGPGMFGFGTQLALERQQGLLTLKRALPMPSGAYIMAKTCIALLFAMIVMIQLSLLARFFAHVPLSAGQLVLVAAVNVCASVPFVAVGLYVGAAVPASGAQAVVYLIYFPMMYLSGLFFPLPGGLQRVQGLWPTYHVNRLAQLAAGVSSGGWALPVIVLVAITAICGALAIRRLARVG